MDRHYKKLSSLFLQSGEKFLPFLLSFKEKIEFIARATYQHARNLAFFTTLYKSICYLLQRIFGRRHPVQNFIAAFTCGYFVFGENNKVNMQVLVVNCE